MKAQPLILIHGDGYKACEPDKDDGSSRSGFLTMSDNAKLSDKPWNQLTEAEKRAWSEAAAKKGPALFGGATVDPMAFRDTVVRSWNRNQKHTY